MFVKNLREWLMASKLSKIISLIRTELATHPGKNELHSHGDTNEEFLKMCLIYMSYQGRELGEKCPVNPLQF